MSSDNGTVLMKGYVWATGADIGFRIGFKRYYFVLSDFLYYYETEESFTSGSTPVGGISLDAFCICKNVERGMFKLAVFAYPYSVEFSVDSAETLDKWVKGFETLSNSSKLSHLKVKSM